MIGWVMLLTFFVWAPVYEGFTTFKVCTMVCGTMLIAATTKRQFKPNGTALYFLALASILAMTGQNRELSLYGLEGDPAHSIFGIGFLVFLTCFKTNLRWLKTAGVLLSIHAILQRFNFDPLIHARELPTGRAISYIGSPVDLGAILAMAFPVSGFWAPLVVSGLWATGSRAAWLGAGCSLLRGKWRWLIIPIVLLAMLIPNQPKDMARKELWKMSWRSFVEHPILGTGPGTYILTFVKFKTPEFIVAMGQGKSQVHAHSDIFEILCTMGLVGLLMYILLVTPLLAIPSFLAVFIVAKFDPLAFEVLCCAALVAASKKETYETH